MMDASTLLRDLVALPGPPGQETAVREYLGKCLAELGLSFEVDAKGNLLTSHGNSLPDTPAILITAHMDEIALLVRAVYEDGTVLVSALGGAFPWKWGEGPVEIFSRGGALIPGLLSIGSIHTASSQSPAKLARDGVAPTWDNVRVVTGVSGRDLHVAGVRVGSRVVIARSRRAMFPLGGDLVASYFLDDRADLVAWLLAIEATRGLPGFEKVLWAATSSEEVGGEGALFLMHKRRPDICIALEIGPTTPDAPFPIDENPTVWVTDSYSTMDPRDLDLIAAAAAELDLDPHYQAVTRGGSDASCAASHGLCARPVTLAFAAENSHGFEIMHKDAPETLARLLVAYLSRVVRALGQFEESDVHGT